MIHDLRKTFIEKFSMEPFIFQSPGRINIIGEHTDYNDGLVLPAAIDKAMFVAINKRDDDMIICFAANFEQSIHCSIRDIHPNQSWSTYIFGIVDQLIKRNYQISGFNLVIDGNIPIGAGLSSSAALECVLVFALNDLFELGITRLEMIRIAQAAEHIYAGVKCGIMDMFTSILGKEGNAIQLNCRTVEYVYKPLPLEGYKIVIFNTNIKHHLANSAYNQRRLECEQGVEWVREHRSEVEKLCDVNIEMLNEYVLSRNRIVYNRCRYVIEEIQRVKSACADLDNHNLIDFGKKMFASHEGLANRFEVSCRELNILVDAVKKNPGVIGARMMGGGFGGCTINIVKEENINELVESVDQLYEKETGLKANSFIANTTNGTSKLWPIA